MVSICLFIILAYCLKMDEQTEVVLSLTLCFGYPIMGKIGSLVSFLNLILLSLLIVIYLASNLKNIQMTQRIV